ncbi:MAG: DUF3303 domain-containing protein [Methyloceanibacter sp.]|uniref:DUF3303 domain-containing protein n=1 Tax=Methyloceanibacter sp. TaxID=1965321 RepID=UPI003EE17A39
MLFVCYVTIDPESRDEVIARFKDDGIVEPKGVKLIGAWIALTQQETWSIFEADSAEAIMKLFEPWTDLNVHQIAPVMDFAALKKYVDAND